MHAREQKELSNLMLKPFQFQTSLPEAINLRRACEQCAHLPVCAAQQKIEVLNRHGTVDL